MSKKIREILFRGQTRRYGEKVRIGDGAKMPSHWVYGGVLQGAGSHSVIYGGENVDDISEGLDKHVVYTDTLGQFTGLTDKNGKKIFEGDVFKFPDEIFESYYTYFGTEDNSWEVENCGVVGYDEYYGRYDFVQYRYENNAVEADLHENKDIDFADFVRKLEVIGNIHDNPELLKEETDG